MQRSSQSISVLVVEDTDTDYLLLKRQFDLKDRQVSLTRAKRVGEAVDLISSNSFDAVITDIGLPDGSGVDVVRSVRGASQLIPTIVLTGNGSEATAVRSIKSGADDYLTKDRHAFAQLPGRLRLLVTNSRLGESGRTVAELRQLKDRFRDFAEVASDWFWEKGPDLCFTFVSSSVKPILGVDPSYFVGKSLWEIVSRNPPEGSEQHEADVREHRRFRNFTYDIVSPDGSTRTIRVSGKPFFDESGEFLGYRGIGTDVTKEIAAATLLKEAKRAAEAANQAKSEFLAVMSHELRTPLNAIIGFTDALLLEMVGPLLERQKEYIKDVGDAGKQLLSLVNDILDLSKIQSDGCALQCEWIDVRELVKHSIVMLGGVAQAGQVKLEEREVEYGLSLYGDTRAVRQVLLNILSNAVKFTLPSGTVTVSAHRTAHGTELKVEDTGIGIAPHQLELVTKPFYQAESALARKHQGTGLGLAIVDGLMAAHGGTLTLHSAIGEGTNVRLFFPNAAPS